jgi:hypothetical protein
MMSFNVRKSEHRAVRYVLAIGQGVTGRSLGTLGCAGWLENIARREHGVASRVQCGQDDECNRAAPLRSAGKISDAH